MSTILTDCPICDGELNISAFTCKTCGLTLQKDFELNCFNYLTDGEMQFLCCFLANHGNFRNVQNELDISYLQAKKEMQNLLEKLNLAQNNFTENSVDISRLKYEPDSTLASDIIKKLLYQNGGKITVKSLQKKEYEIVALKDGASFYCAQLPFQPEYIIFDLMIKCLHDNGGNVIKGNGRDFKMGHEKCDEKTLVGYLGKHYFGQKSGESTLDPIFVLAAVLDYAGLAENCMGYMKLKQRGDFK